MSESLAESVPWWARRHDQHCPANQGGACIHEDGCPISSVSPCFANCGQPACQKLGCVRVYNAEHRDTT